MDLHTAQIELEEEMRGMGIARYRKQFEDAVENDAASRTQPVRRLLIEGHAKVVASLQAFVADAKTGRPGKRHAAVALVERIGDYDLMAYLALRSVLDSIMDRASLSATAVQLSTVIEDELHYRAFEEQIPTAYRATVRKLKDKGNADYKRRSATQTARKLGVKRPTEGWTSREKLLLGVKLIETVIEQTGLAHTVRVRSGRNTPTFLEATEATREWIKTENARREWLSPMYMPCVVQPKQWTNPFDGGYHTNKVRRLTLIKTRSRQYLGELHMSEMPAVYNAINALQNTAWSVNGKVLGVMRDMWDRNVTLGVLPEGDVLPIPQKPAFLEANPKLRAADMTPEQRKLFVDWKSSVVMTYESNAKHTCHRLGFSRMLWTAEKFSTFEEFFFPYTLDFRGRAYPTPMYLQPQGDDAQRSLLQFSNAVPITDEVGALWLAVHGAGCWGVDKLTLEARQQWVFDNELSILAAAQDPLANTFWTKAEKPWQALAFCFDWAGYRREGYSYESSLPIQMDGTCNGLQNFSAILRDEVGGAAVNLVPADKPQDIYAKVAEVVERRCKELAAGEGDDAKYARQWLGHIDRKLCKRPVMTLAYGAKQYGFRQMIFTDTVAPWRSEDPASFPFEDSGFMAAGWMGDLIYRCVGEVVVAARSAMDWLQEAARIATKEGLAVNWRTPTGLVVQQAYTVRPVTVVRVQFQKEKIDLNLRTDAGRLDGRKQSSGVSPNWVHSLDASHMMRTINACHALGMRSFCFIHDSYGTHAGNAGTLAAVLREEFVRMYSETDVLADFARDLKAVLPEGTELPTLPAHGTLDLQAVLDSAFFFA